MYTTFIQSFNQVQSYAKAYMNGNYFLITDSGVLILSNCVCANNFTVRGTTGMKKLRGDITKRLDLSFLKKYIQESMLGKKRELE